MNLFLADLLDRPSLLPGRCLRCGVSSPLNAHHAIPGRRRDPRNPRLHFCGSGTTGCHGRFKELTSHLRWRGGWELLDTDTPTKYEIALETPGWRSL